MILLPFLLAIFSWLLGLRLFGQHRFINIFEQIVLWFVSALSLFVFEMFLSGIIFGWFSFLLPCVTFIVIAVIFVFTALRKKGFLKDILHHIREDFQNIFQQIKSSKLWKTLLFLIILRYVVMKIFMVFQINTHMPTYDEDAVSSWDIKTKVFTENKSLVLDKTDPEFLWSSLERNIFAPLTDTYFLLMHTWNLTWYTNVISPIMYLFSILLLFWIFLRKSNLMFAFIGSYIFASLPFVFVHGIGSYRNFISWALLFIFIFYLFDQIFPFEQDHDVNLKIMYPLLATAFLVSTIRNESFILSVSIIIICSFVYFLITKKTSDNKKYSWLWVLIPFSWLLIWWLSSKYIQSLYPAWVSLNVWWIASNTSMLSSFFANLYAPWVLNSIWDQAFFHTDYNMVFLVFVVVMIVYAFSRIPLKHILAPLLSFAILIWWTLLMLIANVASLWLKTHFWFVRFSIVYIIFMVYLIVYMMYHIHKKIYPVD